MKGIRHNPRGLHAVHRHNHRPGGPTSVGPFARGRVTAIMPISCGSILVLTTVAWVDGESGQVNAANLELQPGNPPLERPQLKPLAGVRRPGGSIGTSIMQASSIG